MILESIMRHAAMATGNFRRIFGEVDLPPLPAAAAKMLALASKEDASLREAGDIVAEDPAVAAKVLKVVNSAAMGLPRKVGDVHRAVNLLGMARTRGFALGVGVLQAVPKPGGGFFEAEAFWRDSLAKGLFAGALATRICPDEAGEAFSGGLLQNMALPVLLTQWAEYYEPVLKIWREGDESLPDLETEAFGWHHAEAAAWMAKNWSLPDVLICCLGLHHSTWAALAEKELLGTPVEAVALSSALPGEIRPTRSEVDRLASWAINGLGITHENLVGVLLETENAVKETSEAFDVRMPEGWGLTKRFSGLISADDVGGEADPQEMAPGERDAEGPGPEEESGE